MAQKLDVSRMRVASPCRVGWDSMVGDDRARFCGSCDRHVYNIVGLSRTEIESLVEKTEGRLCVRMYQRADDTVLTQDCPVGLRALRKRAATFAGAALSALLGLVSVGFGQKPNDCMDSKTKVFERVKTDEKNGQISGLVVDMNGALVDYLEIRLQLDKRSVAKVRSDGEGNFNLPDLKPAENYTLRVDAQKGWKQQITEPFAVGSGEKVSLALCLQPDNVYEVVGLYSEPVEIVLDGTKPTGTFVPRETYPLPPTPKETPPEPRPTRP